MHEPLTNIRKVIALICERDMPTHRSLARDVWRGVSLHRAAGKFVIAINEDIDPTNADALLWAMSYRANASLDMHVLPHRDQGHGPRSLRNGGEDASVLIDATLKEDFPPISLPKREYMENARKVIWEELGLPQAQAGIAVVRLFARRMGAGIRRDGEARRRKRLLGDGRHHRSEPAQRRHDEHRDSPSETEEVIRRGHDLA